MATSAEIKSNNNTLIRLKTAPKSITKANIADQLDAGIDYTAQEVALKQAILVSGSNIKTINGASLLGGGDLDIGGSSLDLTRGAISGVSGNTAILTFGINDVGQTSSDSDKVILPETGIKIGQSIYVFCESNIRIRGNVAGTSAISINVFSSVSSIDVLYNERYRFTKISSTGWIYEKI